MLDDSLIIQGLLLFKSFILLFYSKMSVLGIEGERESGMDVRNNNSIAITSIANIVKTSLGPQGLDKMMVDDIGDVVITNDGATILQK